MLVGEAFEVNVATLPAGEDPDTFVRRHSREAYGQRLKESQPYLEYLLDRAAEAETLTSADGRARLVARMLPVASRIPDRVRLELFVEALASRARIPGELIFAELRKSASHRPSQGPAPKMPSFSHVTKAEKGLIWMLIHDPAPALAALAALDPGDVEGLDSRSVLDLARKLNEDRGFSPSVLLERLTMGEAQLVTAIASESEAHVHEAEECARILRRRRYERERASVQQQIDRLQQQGSSTGEQLERLLVQKYDLIQRINALI
jgi:DNA primase